MNYPTVIPYHVFVGQSGRTYGLGTSIPGEPVTLEARGYTVRWPDGTTGGTGQQPFPNKAAAEEWLAKFITSVEA